MLESMGIAPTMLPDVENLIALQAADKEIRRLKDEIAALPKRVAVIEEKLAGTKAVLENAKSAVKADEASRRKYESAIQDLQQKISKYRDQSLEVKTNEQYKALMTEIQFAEQDIRGNEDKILELMMNAESRERETKAAEAELKAETAEIEKEKVDARQCTAEDEKEMTEWNGRRDKARAGVDADLLQHYDRVARHRGTGLAEARNQKCTGCSVLLRPQTYNEVRSGTKTVICESCQRILYFNPANESEAETASMARRRRPRPKADSDQAWYYRADFGTDGEVFLVYLKVGDTWQRRAYDLHTGRLLGEPQTAEGNYHAAFASELEGATRLNGHWERAELEEWSAELPMVTLDALQRDLNAARVEANHAAHGQSHAATVRVERPAAS